MTPALDIGDWKFKLTLAQPHHTRVEGLSTITVAPDAAEED
jgi:hypothetical protein